MLKFFKKEKRTLKDAKDFFASASKVYNYRRDLMPPNVVDEYAKLLEEAETLILKKEYDSADFDRVRDSLESFMKKYGGKIYPLTTIADYVETIVVAGILALSVRSFFVSPFKIPTNSMYPSFYGMTSQVYKKGQASPSMFEKIYNWTIKSASNYNLNAEDSGNLYIEIASTRGGIFACELENSKILGVWPTYNKKYTFYVNGTKSYLTVPADFNFEEVMLKAYPFGTDGKSLDKYVDALRNSGKIVQNNGTLWLDLGKINKGESILNFDILGGDMLFVDKFTYNFKKPQIGEPIVFLTRYCEGLTERNGGVPDDKYYIKRLVGKGGDSLKVEGSILMRNKEPIKGSPAFKKNFEKEGNYCGYIADGALANNAIVKVPERFYYAMGDNSANSLDSRYWGFVPEKAIVGKSLLIFYPFTERWGHTK